MYIAHLPAGYLLYKGVVKCRPDLEFSNRKSLLICSLVGSVLPDFDMVYWHFSQIKTFHHSYWTHCPAFWAGIYLITFLLFAIHKRLPPIQLHCLMASVFIHLVLDTPVGRIKWLFPLSEKYIYFDRVLRGQFYWAHWIFWIEIAITFTAIGLFLRSCRSGKRKKVIAR